MTDAPAPDLIRDLLVARLRSWANKAKELAERQRAEGVEFDRFAAAFRALAERVESGAWVDSLVLDADLSSGLDTIIALAEGAAWDGERWSPPAGSKAPADSGATRECPGNGVPS